MYRTEFEDDETSTSDEEGEMSLSDEDQRLEDEPRMGRLNLPVLRDGHRLGDSAVASFDSSKRLRKELTDITLNPPPLCSAGLKDDNIYHWVATIIGPPGTPYEGGVFSLSMDFSRRYPFEPPEVKFLTRIYHCNVSRHGDICVDILDKEWSAAFTVSSVLLSVCSLLTDCNPRSPLQGSIATLYRKNRQEHDRKAREYTHKYANSRFQTQ